MKFQMVVGLILIGGVAACGTSKLQKKKAEREQTTRLQLRELADDINQRVQLCASELMESTDSRALKRVAIRWQIGTVRATQRALHHPDPRWSIVELWAGVMRVQRYLEQPEAVQELADSGVAIVSKHMDYLDALIGRRSDSVLTDSQLQSLRDAAQKVAMVKPISAEEMQHPGGNVNLVDSESALAIVAALPSELFSLGGGVKDTAMAVSDVAKVADRGVDGIETMPQMVRWQTELLLMSVEENDTVAGLRSNADRLTAVAESIGKSVETLPGQIEEAVTRILKELESSQPELRATLVEGRATVGEARETIGAVGPLLDKVGENGTWIEKSVAGATDAGKAWEGTFRELNLLVNPPEDPKAPPPEPSPPFDMKDLVSTAEWTTKAAIELRATVSDVRGIVEGEGLDERMQQVDKTAQNTLDLTSAHAAALIDVITWRAAALIGLFFVLLFVYRVFSVRIGKG